MALNLPTVLQRFSADASGFQNAANQIKSQSDQIGASLRTVGANMTKFVTLPLVAGAGIGLKAFGDWEKTAAITDQLIETTGGAAGVTGQHIRDLGSEMQRLTGVSDETVAATANMILSFKNIRNQGDGLNAVFDRTVKASQDIATVMQTDIRSAAMQLAKAVEDPARGMTMLRRAGVTFTEEQENVIKAMVESGKLLDAQKFLLDAVEGQVGGTAAAVGKTLPAALERMKNSFMDAMERIGAALAPFVKAVLGFFSGLFGVLSKLPGPIVAVGVAFGALVAAAGPLLWIIGTLQAKWALMATTTIPQLALSMLRLTGVHWTQAAAAMGGSVATNTMSGSLKMLAISARLAGQAILAQLRALMFGTPVTAAITVVLMALTAAIAVVVSAFRWAAQNVEPFKQQLQRLREIWNTHVLPVFKMIVKVISTAAVPILNKLKDVVTRVFTSIAEWLERNQDNIKRWATAAVSALLLTVRFIKDVVAPVIITAIGGIITIFVDAIQIMWNFVKAAKHVGEIIGKALAGDFEGAGKAASSLVQDLEDIASAAKSAVIDVPRKALEAQANAAAEIAAFTSGAAVDEVRKEVEMQIDRAIKDAEKKAEAPAPEGDGAEVAVDEDALKEVEAPPIPPVEIPELEMPDLSIAGAAPLDKIDAASGKFDVAGDKMNTAADAMNDAADTMARVAISRAGQVRIEDGRIVREGPEAIRAWFREIARAATR